MVGAPGEDAECDLGLALHTCTIHGLCFRIPTTYILDDTVGQGAFGIVYSAMVLDTKESVAIKRIEDVFDHYSFTKRTLRELRILRILKHENILRVKDVFVAESKLNYRDVYVVSELMETDLTAILRSSQDIGDEHGQFFLYQILRGVKYIHSAMVVHRDLKPRNLLINSNCDLKICDFGLARASYADKEFRLAPLTEYVCTRWYRAPELLCCWTDYSQEVDIWSIGCIFAEILGRKALFPGQNSEKQLQLIIDVLGTPTENDLEYTNVKFTEVVKKMTSAGMKSFESLYPKATATSLSLLKWMLQFNPANRPTVCEALQDAYLGDLHSLEDEPSHPPIDRAEFEFERRKITTNTLREELFREILHYHPEKQQEYLRANTEYSLDNYRLLQSGESLDDTDDFVSSRSK
eukprot:GEMP01042318.1.p1 GENE.GEMP01042318.1~~GEMP01042318.1.p1  ORF type:complete len:408 (+),score=101.42 GEMP01042318.1:287-1510(+)